MPNQLRIEKLASGVVLSDAQTAFDSAPVNITNAAPGFDVVFYAIGSARVASGTYSATLLGALSRAGLDDANARITVDATLFNAVGNGAVGRQEPLQRTAPGSVTLLPWLRAAITRATGAGTGITVDMWAVWWEALS